MTPIRIIMNIDTNGLEKNIAEKPQT